MAKIIAVWGSPESGKTTFATKLAKTIYENYQSTVLVLYADNTTPTLPVIFPNYKKDFLYSVGVALSKTDITQESVINQIVTVKGKQNFGFLGFIDSENKYTYPKFDDEKVRALFVVLSTLADYVIIDCTSTLDNKISEMAIKEADEVIRLATPDLKSQSFYSSQLSLYSDPLYKLEKHIQGINVPNEELYMPIDERKSHLHDVSFILPYCRQIKQQMLDGCLLEGINDKNYDTKMKLIADKVVEV